MAYQGISTGTSPNDGTGDDLLTGAIKINSNFEELYSYARVSGFSTFPITNDVIGNLQISNSNFVSYSSNVAIVLGSVVTVSTGSKFIILG
jgi:hypothetical protein